MAGKYFPDSKLFRQKARKGGLTPICRELPADLDTPVSLFLKLGQSPPTFLLESVERGENLGRYSFMGLRHSLMLESKGNRAIIHNGSTDQEIALEGGAPLHLIQEIITKRAAVRMPELPPFCGGAVGYLAYDIANFFEELPQCSHDELDLPDCFFLFADTLLAFDHVQHKMKIIANAYVDDDVDVAYHKAISEIETIVAKLAEPLPAESAMQIASDYGATVQLASNISRDEFAGMVSTAREYIAAGDAIQIVLSQRLRRKTSAKPFDIYRALRMVNPSPYMFYLDFGRFQLIGSSPEMLVKLDGERAESRPIAGEDAFSLLRASFPAGTVSGAPKIRAMQIIAELEKTRRGPYAGAVGYFDFTGNMDTCITIRTIVMKGDTVYLQAGAGIVTDSDPFAEYQETLDKLKALEKAIIVAEESKC